MSYLIGDYIVKKNSANIGSIGSRQQSCGRFIVFFNHSSRGELLYPHEIERKIEFKEIIELAEAQLEKKVAKHTAFWRLK